MLEMFPPYGSRKYYKITKILFLHYFILNYYIILLYFLYFPMEETFHPDFNCFSCKTQREH